MLCEMSLKSGTRGFPNRRLPQTKKLFVPKDGETVEVQQRRTSEFSYGAWGTKVRLLGPLLCKFPDGMAMSKQHVQCRSTMHALDVPRTCCSIA